MQGQMRPHPNANIYTYEIVLQWLKLQYKYQFTLLLFQMVEYGYAWFGMILVWLSMVRKYGEVWLGKVAWVTE